MTNVPRWPPGWPTPVADSSVGLVGLEIDDQVVVGHRRGQLAARFGGCQPIGLVHGGIDAATAETLASMGTADDMVERPELRLAVSNDTSLVRR